MRRATTVFSQDVRDSDIYEKYEPHFVKGFTAFRSPLALPLEPDSDKVQEAIHDIRNAAEDPLHQRYRLLYDTRTAWDPHYLLINEVNYTKKELEAIHFFQMDVGDPLEMEGVNSSHFGTQYTGGCPICGLGKQLAGDLLINRRLIRKYKIGILEPNYFVSSEVRQLIEETGLTGVSFEQEVKDYKGRELPQPFYVMHIHHTLPPLSTSTWLENVKRYCKCEHGYIFLRSDLQYEREKLEGAMDFNLTTEYLSNYDIQFLIVSAKTRKVFREHKVGWARYTPVLLTDGVVGTNPYLDPPPGLG